MECRSGPTGWGVPAHSSFSLITSAVEADVAAGEQHTIASAHNLCGVDEDGLVRFGGTPELAWADVLHAVDASLYRGDPERLVAYPCGVAGGLSPDGFWDYFVPGAIPPLPSNMSSGRIDHQPGDFLRAACRALVARCG